MTKKPIEYWKEYRRSYQKEYYKQNKETYARQAKDRHLVDKTMWRNQSDAEQFDNMWKYVKDILNDKINVHHLTKPVKEVHKNGISSKER